LDFCPKREKHEAFQEVYRQYFDQVCKIGCPYLSALHFLKGGAFSYIQGDIFSLNKGILKSLECGETDYKKTVFSRKFKFLSDFVSWWFWLGVEENEVKKTCLF